MSLVCTEETDICSSS